MMFPSNLSRALFACLVAASVGAPALAAPADRDHGVRAEDVIFDVTLSDGEVYKIAGTYYHRGTSHNRTLQVAVHGATYDRGYWDGPIINGEDYSYAEYMVENGFSVLAIDQLGAGESSTPFGWSLNLAETASGLHQVLDALRDDDNPLGGAFDDIALVGHSNGSLTAIYEESVYGSADALVVTGWGHTYAPLGVDPDFINSLLAAPYLAPSALPEPFRAALFYYAPQADPDVISYDAANLATTMSAGQFYDLLVALSYPTIDGVAGVTGPVYVQMGEFDPIAPGANAALEPGYWTSADSVTVDVLQDMGHDFNLHRNHLDSWAGIADWLDEAL